MITDKNGKAQCFFNTYSLEPGLYFIEAEFEGDNIYRSALVPWRSAYTASFIAIPPEYPEEPDPVDPDQPD